MLIVDLPFLENVSENELIFGSASAAVGAHASASGDNTLALTETSLVLKEKKNGKVKLKGKATALAVGDADPIAETYHAVDGCTKVKVKIIEKEGENFAYEKLKIKAKC